MGGMSIEMAARQTLRLQIRAQGGELRSLADRALLRRIWRFAGRHHRRLGVFVGKSVVSALLTVATPVLAGKVVDVIVRGGAPVVVIGLVEAGRIVERGTHEQLLARRGRYAELYETQFGADDAAA